MVTGEGSVFPGSGILLAGKKKHFSWLLICPEKPKKECHLLRSAGR